MISLTGKRQTWNKAEIGSIDQNCAEKSCFQAIALQKYVMMQVKAPNSSLDEIYAYKKNMYIKRNIISFMNSNKCALSQNQEMCRRVGNKIAKAFFFYNQTISGIIKFHMTLEASTKIINIKTTELQLAQSLNQLPVDIMYRQMHDP